MPRDIKALGLKYGHAHRAERARWVPIVRAGQAKCARCGGQIAPTSRWALDHADDGTTYLGPSHWTCNTVASNQKYRDPQPNSRTKW